MAPPIVYAVVAGLAALIAIYANSRNQRYLTTSHANHSGNTQRPPTQRPKTQPDVSKAVSTATNTTAKNTTRCIKEDVRRKNLIQRLRQRDLDRQLIDADRQRTVNEVGQSLRKRDNELWANESEEICTICMHIIYQNELKAVTLCNHKFHRDCIFQQLLTNIPCPSCNPCTTNPIQLLVIEGDMVTPQQQRKPEHCKPCGKCNKTLDSTYSRVLTKCCSQYLHRDCVMQPRMTSCPVCRSQMKFSTIDTQHLRSITF